MGTSFVLFISRLNKTENGKYGVRKDLREKLDTLLMKLIKDLGAMAKEAVHVDGKILIRYKDFESIIQEYFGEGPLERVIKKEARRAVENKGKDLILPISRIKRCSKEKISTNGLIYLAGILEQVLIEIFDKVMIVSKKKRKKNMTLRDLWKSIEDDEELKRLFSHE
jgi:histone H3/H4